ncbi:hypothetical protein D3C72_1056760 [compost metagenome]
MPVNLSIILDHPEVVEHFEGIPGAHCRLETEVRQGFSGEELVSTIVISFISSAAYDVVKSTAQIIVQKIGTYLANRGAKEPVTVVLNGLKYQIKDEADLVRLEADIVEVANDDQDSASRN